MVEAQAAVPCWIMSHARVSETLPAKLGAFDLVIVDEASQSDLWALPAVLRGKQILVVGDDKQVSPEAGFVSAAKITELRRRFLAGQPFEAVLTADMSLYDISSSVFAASKVMLREHFRCVQPIIAYSNRVFYKGFIQPVRIPKASERLDPPLVDVYVANGYRSTKGHNPSEADFIVAEIEAILRDPKMAGRTLGVVTLLGPEQALLIDKQVRALRRHRARAPSVFLWRRAHFPGQRARHHFSQHGGRQQEPPRPLRRDVRPALQRRRIARA